MLLRALMLAHDILRWTNLPWVGCRATKRELEQRFIELVNKIQYPKTKLNEISVFDLLDQRTSS